MNPVGILGWLLSNWNYFLKWSSQSPGINPAENMWTVKRENAIWQNSCWWLPKAADLRWKKRGCRTCNHLLADCFFFFLRRTTKKSFVRHKNTKNILKSSCHGKITVAKIIKSPNCLNINILFDSLQLYRNVNCMLEGSWTVWKSCGLPPKSLTESVVSPSLTAIDSSAPSAIISLTRSVSNQFLPHCHVM